VARISFIGWLRSIFTTSPPSAGLHLGQILCRIVLELLQIDTIPRDLAEHLTVRRARHAEPDRQRRAMTRQADHAHVVAEILAAELRADAERLRHLQNFLLHLQIAEGVAVGRAVRRQRIEIARRGELHRLHRQSSAEVPPMTMAR
jgi:hypothetical protein